VDIQKPPHQYPFREPPTCRRMSCWRALPHTRHAVHVTWQGIENPGNHQPLIEAAAFERVQHVLAPPSIWRAALSPTPSLGGHPVVRPRRIKADLRHLDGATGDEVSPLALRWPTHRQKWLRSSLHMPEDGVETAIVGLWHQTQMPRSALDAIRARPGSLHRSLRPRAHVGRAAYRRHQARTARVG
jgi:hypothetical protein